MLSASTWSPCLLGGSFIFFSPGLPQLPHHGHVNLTTWVFYLHLKLSAQEQPHYLPYSG